MKSLKVLGLIVVLLLGAPQAEAQPRFFESVMGVVYRNPKASCIAAFIAGSLTIAAVAAGVGFFWKNKRQS